MFDTTLLVGSIPTVLLDSLLAGRVSERWIQVALARPFGGRDESSTLHAGRKHFCIRPRLMAWMTCPHWLNLR